MADWNIELRPRIGSNGMPYDRSATVRECEFLITDGALFFSRSSGDDFPEEIIKVFAAGEWLSLAKIEDD